MITKEKAIIETKNILKKQLEKFYRKNNKGRPNALTIEQSLDAIFLCSY
jgi:hypothetical protein